MIMICELFTGTLVLIILDCSYSMHVHGTNITHITRDCRWSAFVVDGKVKVLNVEKVPSEFKVSGGEVILGQI